MERLTYDFRIGDNHCWQVKGADNYLCKKICEDQGDDGCEGCPIKKAIDRLAAYEDTGLGPEEAEAQSIALAQCKPYIDAICDEHGKMLINPIRLAALAQAEKDGRVVAYMPGDKVCDRFGTPWIVESSEIHLIGAEIKHLYRCGHPGTEDYCAMYEEEILPREEAEAALKKREEADNEAD